MAELITALFDSEAAAEYAVAQLNQLGYGSHEISMIIRSREFVDPENEAGGHPFEGVGTGAAIGGTIGAVLAGLLAVGSVAIPGVGLVVAGSLAAMFAGGGAGGLAGGVLGWLVGAGIPDEALPDYERGLIEGGVVVAVASHTGDEAHIQALLHDSAVISAGTYTPSGVSAQQQDPLISTEECGHASSPCADLTAGERCADNRAAAEHRCETDRGLDRTHLTQSIEAALANDDAPTAKNLKNPHTAVD